MVAITVRNVDPEVRDGLAARAREAGMSLEEYLRDLFATTVAKPSMEEWLRRVRARVEVSGTHFGADEIVRLIREDRDDPRR